MNQGAGKGERCHVVRHVFLAEGRGLFSCTVVWRSPGRDLMLAPGPHALQSAQRLSEWAQGMGEPTPGSA